MPQSLLESRPLAEAAPDAPSSTGRLQVQLITPGWGSSGYYSPAVLEAAAGPAVFGAGTHMYLDHPSATENYDRPERSVRDLAAVLTTDATWNGSALVAEVQTFGPYRQVLAEMRDAIGLSIRAGAEVEMGEAEGRRGRIVTELVEGTSVDFVTHAGRGGRILQVLESARPSRVVARVRARHDEVTEASARDMREQLSQRLTEAYGGDQSWLWVRDFDPALNVVWYEHETAESSAVYEHPYTVTEGALALSGAPVEVRVETRYVPVDTAATTSESDWRANEHEVLREQLADAQRQLRDAHEALAVHTTAPNVPVDPAGQSTTTESQGGTMPQIEEARLRQLEADAGRVQALESERDAAQAERDAANRQLAETTARQAAGPIVAEAFAGHQLPTSTYTRVTQALVESAPLTADAALDETALRTAAAAARTAAETELAEALAAVGVGRPRGLGAPSATGDEPDVTESTYDRRSASVFGRTSVKGA